MRRVLAILAVAALIAGCGGNGEDEPAAEETPVAEVETGATGEAEVAEEPDEPPGPPDCAELAGTAREGRCLDGSQEYIVVNRDSTLRLPELTVKLVDYELVDALNDTGTGVETPSGVFAVFTLEVKNRLSVPAQFDSGQDQVVLFANENNYTQDFDALNGGDEDSFLWQGEEIQPDATQVGTVIFDIPNSAAKAIERDGNLNVIDFSEATSGGRLKGPLGAIRIYR